MQELLDKFNKLSNVQKYAALIFVCLLMVVVYFFVVDGPKRTEIENLQKQLNEKEVKLAENKAIAQNLAKFQEEVARLDEELQRQLKKLPNKAEIPKVLRTISNLGKKVGLEFGMFSPGAETNVDFYAEVPINITMTGNFHQVALFLDKISQLDRIVNAKNLNFSGPTKKGGKTVVSVTTQLITYRFLEQSS